MSTRLNTWSEQADGERAIVPLLLIFIVVATAISWMAYATLDMHPDLLELYAWGRTPAWGYDKHPPLAAWMAAAWFAVFPTQDWAFQLLAAINAAFGLYCVDLVARQYLSGEKRLLVLILLLLTPAYTFHGLRFNATNPALWTWPLATFCFLRAFKTRTPGWAAAAGFTAALAMLGKYYSGVLIAGFVLAALTHPDRRAYLLSSSPWISAAVGVLALAPNIVWVVSAAGSPMNYAMREHGGSPLLHVLGMSVKFFLAAVLYVSVLLGAYAYLARPGVAAAARSLWPANPDLRLLATIFFTALALPAVFGLLLGLRIHSLWTLPGIFPLPILLLAAVDVPRARARVLVSVLIAVTLLLLFWAPVHAYLRLGERNSENRDHYRPIVQELAALWRGATDRPLPIVTGDRLLAAAMSFYHPDHPRFLTAVDDSSPSGPWASQGIAIVCAARTHYCLRLIDRWQAAKPAAQRKDIEVRREVLGLHSLPGRYVLLIVPPAG